MPAGLSRGVKSVGAWSPSTAWPRPGNSPTGMRLPLSSIRQPATRPEPGKTLYRNRPSRLMPRSRGVGPWLLAPEFSGALPAFRKPAVARPPSQQTPATPPYPLLSRLSRRRKAAPRLAAHHYGRPPQRAVLYLAPTDNSRTAECGKIVSFSCHEKGTAPWLSIRCFINSC